MLRISFFFLLFLPSLAHAILRGQEASENQISAAVHIWSVEKENNKLQFRCSGTIIAPDVVITETSCIYAPHGKKRGETFLISRSSKTDFTQDLADIMKRVLAVVKTDVKHPTENFILLFLSQAIPIKPALLLQQNEAHQLISTEQISVAGWGFTQAPPVSSFPQRVIDYLLGRERDTRVLGTKYIGKSRLGSLMDKELEFGNEPSDALACQGDEGGPIIINIHTRFTNHERLIGMITSNTNLMMCASPSYGLRFDTFSKFIQEKLTLGCQQGERAWCDVKGLIPPEFDDENTLEIKIKDQIIPETVVKNEPSSPQSSSVPSSSSGSPSRAGPKKQGVRNLQIKMESAGCSCMQALSKQKR